MTDFDSIDFFRGKELTADPYPYFDHLREQCPVLREPHHDVVMVTGYDEAVAIYGDTANFSSANSVTGPFPGFPVPLEGDDVSDLIEQYRDDLPFSDQLPTMDPPKHKEHRGLLMRLLTPSRLRENEEFMWSTGQSADRRLHRQRRMSSSSRTSSARSPCTSSPTCSECPRRTTSGSARNCRAPASIGRSRGGLGSSDAQGTGSCPACVFSTTGSPTYIEDRRKNPRKDVLTGLALATFPDGSLPEVIDVVRMAVNLFSAGQETTVRLIATAFQVLGEDPALQDLCARIPI